MVNHPFFTWTNNPDAVSNVYSPRYHRRRNLLRVLLFFVPSLHHLT